MDKNPHEQRATTDVTSDLDSMALEFAAVAAKKAQGVYGSRVDTCDRYVACPICDFPLAVSQLHLHEGGYVDDCPRCGWRHTHSPSLSPSRDAEATVAAYLEEERVSTCECPDCGACASILLETRGRDKYMLIAYCPSCQRIERSEEHCLPVVRPERVIPRSPDEEIPL